MQRNKQKTLNNITLADSAANLTGSTSMVVVYAGLFANFFNTPAGKAITGLGTFITYPIIAISSGVSAFLSWLNVHYDRRKNNQVRKRNVVNAVTNTLMFAAYTVSIIGALVASTLFGLAVPILFMVGTGIKLLQSIGSSIYNAVKAASINPAKATTEEDRQKAEKRKLKYKTRAKNHLKSAGMSLVSFAATTTVFLLGYLVAAPIGIAINAVFFTLSIVGIVAGIKKFRDMRKLEQANRQKSIRDYPQATSSTARLIQSGLTQGNLLSASEKKVINREEQVEESSSLLKAPTEKLEQNDRHTRTHHPHTHHF